MTSDARPWGTRPQSQCPALKRAKAAGRCQRVHRAIPYACHVDKPPASWLRLGLANATECRLSTHCAQLTQALAAALKPLSTDNVRTERSDQRKPSARESYVPIPVISSVRGSKKFRRVSGILSTPPAGRALSAAHSEPQQAETRDANPAQTPKYCPGNVPSTRRYRVQRLIRFLLGQRIP